MSVSNKVSSRAAAFVVVGAIALLAVFAPTGSGGPTQASHGGMDAMSIDLNYLGNSSSAIGAIDTCQRVNNNGTQDADEDFIDGLFVDVVAEGIPAFNDNGTPSNGADDSGGIIGYGYTFNYPPGAPFTVSSQEFNNASVNILAANNSNPNDFFNGSEPTPDGNNLNNRWDSGVVDASDRAVNPPESGDGVLDRLALTADDALIPADPAQPGATTGQYLIWLSDNAHADAGPATVADLSPHSTGLANIAVNQACGTMITSYGYYHPVTPARILDTRTGPPFPAPGPVGHNAEITVDVTGVGGVPATGVSAVVLNTTVTGATAGSFLTVYSSGEEKPLASNLNFGAGQTVPNLVTVGVGPNGNVKVYNAQGQTHVIFDVVGWYGGPASGSRFNPLTPTRILSTRDGIGAPAGIKVGPLSSITVDVTNTFGSGVPASGVTAVVLNVTVTEPTASSFLTVYPQDPKPGVSNLNFGAGQTVPNLVIVKLGSDNNTVKVYNQAGSTHVIFDVVGWYGSASGDVFNALSPSRFLDTRTGPQGVPAGKVQASNPGIITVDVTKESVPSTATGVVVNTTVTEATQPSYLTVYPSNVSPPTASNLNFAASQTVPNLVMVKTGPDGQVKAYNALGQVHVIFDNVGYFAPVPAP